MRVFAGVVAAALLLILTPPPTRAGWGAGSCGPVGPSWDTSFARYAAAPAAASGRNAACPCSAACSCGCQAGGDCPCCGYRAAAKAAPAAQRPGACTCGCGSCPDICQCGSGHRCDGGQKCRCKMSGDAPPADDLHATAAGDDTPADPPNYGVRMDRVGSSGLRIYDQEPTEAADPDGPDPAPSPKVPDFAGMDSLTLVGPAAWRKQVLADVQADPDLAPLRTRVREYDDGAHWQLVPFKLSEDPKFQAAGHVAIVQGPAGPDGRAKPACVYQYAAPADLAGALRDADPNYHPFKPTPPPPPPPEPTPAPTPATPDEVGDLTPVVTLGGVAAALLASLSALAMSMRKK